MQYRTAVLEDKAALFALWQEAFGDTEETVSSFMKTCFREDYTVVAETEKNIVAAIYLLEAELPSQQNFLYVYAAATKKAYRQKGIMTALLDFAKAFAEKQKKDGLYLVPADENLFAYYAKRGYQNAFLKDRYTITKKDFMCAYSLASGVDVREITTAKAYSKIRKEALKGYPSIQYPLETLQLDIHFAKHFQSPIYQIEHGFFHVDLEEDTLEFLEFAIPNLKEQQEIITSAYQQFPKMQTIICHLPHNMPFFMDMQPEIIPAGMILPLQDIALTEKMQSAYLGITLG